MAETLTECCELIDEMTMIYSSQEDIEQVKSVVKVQEELFNLYRSRESAVKDAIQDISNKGTGKVERFDLDPSKYSRFDLVNQLWENIAGVMQ
eukprot:gene18620-22232_t